MMNDRLRSIMTKDVVTVSSGDSLDKVKTLLFEKHFHHIPVVDNGRLTGIVTSWDLMKLNRKFEEYGGFTVKDVMTTKVASLGPDELIGAAAMIFLKHLFHGLPIVDDDGKLVGIVTTHDILKYQFLKEYPHDVFVEETHWID
ncbi:MAG: CBS domain-containing protein [Lewinellaceae bacterium]|nr:CBS domain-containing protein [Saprospiraceae bacterium]MCB9340724.1 CBS domain-containing protein [Lewinellaceae bacterium]